LLARPILRHAVTSRTAVAHSRWGAALTRLAGFGEALGAADRAIALDAADRPSLASDRVPRALLKSRDRRCRSCAVPVPFRVPFWPFLPAFLAFLPDGLLVPTVRVAGGELERETG